jgi:hypothetical protein
MSSKKAVIAVIVCAFYFMGCGRQRAALKWENTSGTEEGFRIYRITATGRTKVAEVGPNIVTYVDENSSRDACYVVTAFNSAGESEPSNIACLPL